MAADEDIRLIPHDIILAFKLFLKSWIQIILAERNIYPLTSFEERNSFNLSVPWTRHPKLDEWLDGLIDTIVQDMKEISCVCLIVHDDDHVRERYVLDLSEFAHLDNESFSDRKIEDTNQIETFNELRGCLYSLIEKIRTLEKPRDAFKFNLICETIGDMNNNWVRDGDTEESENFEDPKKVISLKPVDANLMNLRSTIEVYR